MFIYQIVSIRALITADMEYYNIIANYSGHLTFMWLGKFNKNYLESQGIFIIKQSRNLVTVTQRYFLVNTVK